MPWADLRPNPNLIETFASPGQRALKIGCGFGDDAEQLSDWGFETTAFDIAESAIHECRRRFPRARVTYAVADLLNPPRLDGTIRLRPPELRSAAMTSGKSPAMICTS